MNMSPERRFTMPPNSDPDHFKIRLPQEGDTDFDQDEEWFEFEVNGKRHKSRIHEYENLYRVQGLYEALLYEKLKCCSPTKVVDLLATVLPDWPISVNDLRVLDLGAGNGIAGEIIWNLGAEKVVGLDLIPEAKTATERDRPGAYADYFVADLTKLTDDDANALREHDLNCLLTVATLGFGDIPPLVFANAFNLISETGWLAMTIKEDFLDQQDRSGFSRLIRSLIAHHIVEPQAHHRYCHRVSITGERLFYIALIGRKTQHIPHELVEEAEQGASAAFETSADAAMSTLIGNAAMSTLIGEVVSV